MALPIKETPILRGKDAVRFLEQMYINETTPPTPKEIEDFEKGRRFYEEMKAKGLGDLP
jgi:hypothetical protein